MTYNRKHLEVFLPRLCQHWNRSDMRLKWVIKEFFLSNEYGWRRASGQCTADVGLVKDNNWQVCFAADFARIFRMNSGIEMPFINISIFIIFEESINVQEFEIKRGFRKTHGFNQHAIRYSEKEKFNEGDWANMYVSNSRLVCMHLNPSIWFFSWHVAQKARGKINISIHFKARHQFQKITCRKIVQM